MLVEIPDPEVILSVILAFIAGLGALYAYFKIRPHIKSREELSDVSQVERLEYYEKQLIDMKIRLDALEIQGIEEKPENDSNLELKQILEKLASNQELNKTNKNETKNLVSSEIEPETKESESKISIVEPINPTDHVLHLITNKAMTSRDIQVTLKRTREHTSRLMKKLFEDGLVQRNTESKPYTYSITEKGKTRITPLKADSTTA